MVYGLIPSGKLRLMLKLGFFLLVFILYVLFVIPKVDTGGHPVGVDMLSYDEWFRQILTFIIIAAVAYLTVYEIRLPSFSLRKIRNGFRRENKDVIIEPPSDDMGESILDVVRPKIIEKHEKESGKPVRRSSQP